LSIDVQPYPLPEGTYRVRGRSVSSSRDDRVWAALAQGLAGRPRVRVSRDRGKSYPARAEASLTSVRPVKPAAVMVYGYDGMAKCLFLDLDSSRGGVDLVDADYRELTRWLGRSGALWVEDVSPSGGRHLYVPLQQPVPFTEARDLVEALATRHRSLDPGPHRSVKSGCCRVPGSRHKSGGVQELTQVLGEAIDAITRRNAPRVWDALWRSTAETRAVLKAAAKVIDSVDPSARAVSPENRAGMGAQMLLVVTEGIWDSSRYQSASEARLGALAAAARSGFSLLQVQERMLSGAWAGLSGLYAKYTARTRNKALSREWAKACDLVAATGGPAGDGTVRNSDTSSTKTQRGTPDWLTSWHARRLVVEQGLPATRESQALRMVLRAVEEAAAKADSRTVSFGVRALAEALGMHASTVAAHLATLGKMPDPLITKTASGRGTDADTWRLNSAFAEEAPTTPSKRPAKVFAVRPAFRELGIPAALAYEQLENAEEGLSTTEVATGARIGRTSAHEALESLSNWGLAKHTPAGWVVGVRSLVQVAVMLGADQAAAAQHQKHREERRQWREWLAGREHQPATLAGITEAYPYWLFDPGPGDVMYSP
jgi:hypothetical protein